MAENSASASRRRYPPKKRAHIESDDEEPSSGRKSKSVKTEEVEEDDDDADASHLASPSTHHESPSTSQANYGRLLVTINGITHEPMISSCDRDSILALAAARDLLITGKMLQKKYDASCARLQCNSRIIDFDAYYQTVEGLLSSLPPDLGPSESRTQMRQACTTIDHIFDSIQRQVDVSSKLETKASASRAMQQVLGRLLVFSCESGYTIPEEFSCNRKGRLGLDGKIFMLINGKFDQKRHDTKMMMVDEDPWGGSDWMRRVEELVTLSSRCGEVFKILPRVLEVVEKDAYDPATDYDSRGAPTF